MTHKLYINVYFIIFLHLTPDYAILSVDSIPVDSASSVVPLSPIQELEPGATPFLMVGVVSWLSSRTATTSVKKILKNDYDYAAPVGGVEPPQRSCRTREGC